MKAHRPVILLCTGSKNCIIYCDTLADTDFYIFISSSRCFRSVSTPSTQKQISPSLVFPQGHDLLALNRLLLIWFNVNEIST